MLQLLQACIDEDALVPLLRVQPLSLLHKDKCCPYGEDGGKDGEACKESKEAVAQDEADDSSSCGDGCPGDVAPLHAHELQRSLESLEHGVAGIVCACAAIIALCLAHGVPLSFLSSLDAEEQRQCLGGCNQEDAGSYNHHDRLLENLLSSCKVLNINTPQKRRQPKETNWKQKFQKTQNENICLTYLNTEMNGNFHFLSFCDVLLRVQNVLRRTELSFQQSGCSC